MPSELAIDGGSPVVPAGPPGWPCKDDDIRKALLSAYEDGSWGRYDGPHCDRLCRKLAALHEVKHVTLCSSGTFAVELALHTLRISEGDEVLLAGYDFAGNFRCIEAVGARPVLADITPAGSLDAAQIESAFSSKTKAVIVSHLHSGLADMAAICEVAERLGVEVVEDACQAPGAAVAAKAAGSWGRVAALSFGGSKLLTAGRGGAILTNDDDLQQRAKIYCERGNDAFPLSELQAAVLAPQVEKLAVRNQQRVDSVKRLLDSIPTSLFRPMTFAFSGQASYYKLAWWYDRSRSRGVSREQVLAALKAEGVDVGAGFRGFVKRGASRCRKAGSLERSKAAAEEIILLHHPVLLQPPAVVDAVGEAFRRVSAHYLESGQG